MSVNHSKKLIESFRANDLHTGLALFKKMMAEKLERAIALERKTTYINEDYNGWKNRETWNVALWIGNDRGLYNMARDIARQDSETPYETFRDEMLGDGRKKTADGVRWDDPALDLDALNDMMRELISESVKEAFGTTSDQEGFPEDEKKVKCKSCDKDFMPSNGEYARCPDCLSKQHADAERAGGTQ